MALHNEIEFETEVCGHLAAKGWLYSASDEGYDRNRAMFPEDVLAWVRETHPKAWESLARTHGTAAETTLFDWLRSQLNQRGTLDVIRQGIEMLGLPGKLALAQFKPALAMNQEILARYQANRLRIMRQVHYSIHSKNSIDLVLFLNGLPVATAELKTDFTQSVQDAVDQYRFDRPTKSKGQSAEPLLTFPGGALIHFAVSNYEVQMTTRLEGPETRFLPFNLGNNGAAGNPINPAGHPTAYLWEQIWERESWLEIIGRYMIGTKDHKRQLSGFLFPRYHQLDATRKLRAAVLSEGAGGRYLIQHSAGSGKTNSIAWSAHFLADLHDASQKKLFDSVLVVSDRTVIDSQLQDAIFDFERTTGVVATIKGEAGSKSSELAAALSGDKKIVVCTIQTFPALHKKMSELARTDGKRFAVIADEAHSSQSGRAASKLKAVLSAEEIKQLEDGGEVSTEEILAAEMAARADDRAITFVAFTATPKAKTLELFGRLPDPMRKPGKDNLPAPFHVYSMQQAIEEGFILDVLENYTPWKLAFRLAHGGKEYDDKEVERSAALKGIMGWVRLHPYNIAQKVQIVVEHFRQHVAPLLNGTAKAMIVVGSRAEAVRWQLEINKYIQSRSYPIRTLVAFSGEVKDAELGPDGFTEHSATLNPTLRGRDIREAFKGDEFQILLVANKFQTGFDQPLLCGMYVDKRLAGIQAVQTLSRLNRCYERKGVKKETTYVLDFVNDPAEVLEAFKTYFRTAALSDVTNPNLVLALKAKLDGSGHYDQFEVDRVVQVEMKPGVTQGELVSAVGPVVERLHQKFNAAQKSLKAAIAAKDKVGEAAAGKAIESLQLFRTDAGTFVRLYTFLSQIFNYENVGVEKLAIFLRQVLRVLEFGRERESIDLSKVVLTHHSLKAKDKPSMQLEVDGPTLDPMGGVGQGQVREKQKDLLTSIISKLNELFEGELSDQDKLVYVNNVIKGKLLESETLTKQAGSNTKEQFSNSPDLDREIANAVIDALDAHTLMSTQALNSPEVLQGLKAILLNHTNLWEALKARAAG